MSDDAAAPETGEQSDETLGSRLRAAREARDLSIEKIADELRIEEHVLHALEEDRIGDIKIAPVFIKGYIKQYGRVLELDYDELREAFRRQTDAEDVRLQPNRAIQLRDERQITIWVIAALAVSMVAVALLVWWLGGDGGWRLSSGSDSGESDSVSVAAPLASGSLRSPALADAQDEAEPRTEQTTEQTPEQATVQASGQAGERVGAAAPPPAQANPAAVDRVSLAALSESEGEGDAQAAEEREVGVVAAPLEPAPGSVAMQFDFTDDSWFELTDALGRRLHYDLAESGSRLSFAAVPPAQVLLGNANAVSITVGSVAHAVPDTGRRGNVAIFAIDPAQD